LVADIGVLVLKEAVRVRNHDLVEPGWDKRGLETESWSVQKHRPRKRKTSRVGLVYSLGDNHQVLDAGYGVPSPIQVVEEVAVRFELRARLAVPLKILQGRKIRSDTKDGVDS